MIRSIAIGVAVLLAAPAGAQAIKAPVANGVPHTCLEYYPVAAKRLGEQGSTTLGFVITETGTLRNAFVVNSSGSERLDAAALQCIQQWTYVPAMRNGVAITVPWKVRVDWLLDEDFEEPIDPPQTADWTPPFAAPDTPHHSCEVSFNSRGTAIQPTGPSIVEFTITAAGKTRNIRLTQSSGSTAYDSAAEECIGRWQYVPATRRGKPVPVQQRATVGWARRDGQ